MKITKKILSMILAVVLVLGLLPATVFATETGYVYMSVSYDGRYVNDTNGTPIAFVPVPIEALAAIDLSNQTALNEQGEPASLAEYQYDEDGDGTYDITALHLIIYAHETFYGGDFSEVTFTGDPGSSYFQGGVFGFDENLNYYLNGEYPLASAGWGATSDQIVLESGDYIDMASFSSWDFYMDSNYGFHFFADENGNYTHDYTAETNTACAVKLVRSYSGMGTGAAIYDEPEYEISYGTTLYDAVGTVTTDDSGCAEITFPSAGTWYLWADGGYGCEYPDVIVNAPAYAKVTVAGAPGSTEPEQPRVAQSVTTQLNATMAQLAATITEPAFGTTAGEWTVLSLARGGYFAKDNAYFTDYYDRIVATVNTTAASVNMNGALHKVKSTENSRLIVALSAIGKDATSVGNWDLVEAYSVNGFSWIKKQGLNGTIWALIALDSNNYTTTDTTIRQQCVDAILDAQHDDGGWSLMANKTYASDPDVTGMALTALYPYRNQPEVATAAEEAFACLSAMQHDNGTFASGGSECSESCAWVIVSTTMWGINPDTDSRFIKNGKSVVDGLLAHYLADSATFQHIIGAGSNAMATDQSCYALIAYDRFINGKTALFDYSDVTFGDENSSGGEMVATLGLPTEINPGAEFNGIISINKWDNQAGYKLIDFEAKIPTGVTVTDVTAGSKLDGGAISWNLEEETGKLRVVYFDANANATLTITGEEFPAELFTINMKANNVTVGSKLEIALSNMSVKLSADSENAAAMVTVNTTTAKKNVEVVQNISFSAKCLYTGDDVDLIPSTKKAVAVVVTGITGGDKLTYNDGTNTIELKYSAEITTKSGVATYVALVDASIAMENFENKSNFTILDGTADTICFGDTNGDGVVNAQDALGVVDAWLRKSTAPADDKILVMNVNGDSRINTFDALGIVEVFVNRTDYIIVTKAATTSANQ